MIFEVKLNTDEIITYYAIVNDTYIKASNIKSGANNSEKFSLNHFTIKTITKKIIKINDNERKYLIKAIFI